MSSSLPSVDIREVPLRLLAICGSPRKNSNSQKLLDIAVEGAKEVGAVELETFEFFGKKISPCTACNKYCIEHKACVHKDAFVEFRDKWNRAEAVIWSMPVYTMAGPAVVRAVIDRLGEVLLGNRIEELREGGTLPRFLKAGGVIVQGSSRWGGQEVVIEGMHEHLVLMDCIPVNADMPHSHCGVAGHIPHGTEPNDDELLLTNSRLLGKRVAQVGKMLKLGKLAVAPMLGDEYFCSPDSFAETLRPEVN